MDRPRSRFRETGYAFWVTSAAVFRTARQRSTTWRHVFLTLAALAVVMKVLVPPGFMAAARSGELPFPIMLCTGEGAVKLQSEPTPRERSGSHQSPANGGHDAPCAFAGLAAAAPPPSGHFTALTPAAYRADLRSAPEGLSPGRGLTGPPLPPRGPPSLLI